MARLFLLIYPMSTTVRRTEISERTDTERYRQKVTDKCGLEPAMSSRWPNLEGFDPLWTELAQTLLINLFFSVPFLN